MYQLPTSPQPPAVSKRREAFAVINANPTRHTFSETVTLAEAGAPDDAFYNFLKGIGK